MLRYVTGASAFLMATASASAFAQAAQSEPAQTGEVGLSEITVTARKITENRQKAPASITVLESEALTTAGIKVPSALEKLLPGTDLRIEGTLAQPYIRCVGSNPAFPYPSPAFALTFHRLVL